MFYSPLRYPGGKNKLAKFITLICEGNNINGHYVEPYAGGASVALYLLLENKVNRITINDIDPSIYAFWHSVLYDTENLCQLIKNTKVTLENWHKCKQVQENKQSASLLALGFSTFFLNRTNISGIIDAGIIGGLKQTGPYKLDCRFNKVELLKRINTIAARKSDITLLNLDAIDLINKIKKESFNSNTIFYFDPPYYLKGKSLYLNYYDHDDHTQVSKLIKTIKNIHWIVSYDNTPKIIELFKFAQQKFTYEMYHTANSARKGEEVLFFSDSLKLPLTINPLSRKDKVG